MPELPTKLNFISRRLENGAKIVEVQFHPEASLIARAADDDEVPLALAEQEIAELASLVQKAVDDVSPLTMWQRRVPGAAEVESVEIRIQPPKDDKHWLTPVELVLQALVWQYDENHLLARVPALRIEVFAKDRETLDSRLRSHIRFALQRKRWSMSLQPMVQLARFDSMAVESTSVTIRVRTPKQIEASEGEADEEPVLKEVADRLDRRPMSPAFEVDDDVKLVAEALTGETRRSVMLIGPSGVGKTAIIGEVVRRRAELDLEYVEFWGTSGSRLVAGMCGYGMWQERCDQMCRELRKRDAILYAGNLPELVEAGKGGGNSQGIADFLRNRIDRGEIVLVAECTPDQFTVLERESPGVVQSFLQLRIEEPTLNEGRSILMEYSLWAATNQRRLRERRRNRIRNNPKGHKLQANIEKVVPTGPPAEPLTIAAIEKLDRLHRRYSAYSAYPGRAVRFLHNLIEDCPANRALDADDITRAFSEETGLPRVLLDEAEPLDPNNVREWFSERVIGQGESVDVIVDLITAVKAGLTRPDRPIASLLFIGPTGVGKTEMAKTIAEYFFRDRSRMIRIDMSEYSDPSSIDRLVGGASRTEGLLTSRVRDQPFGVVLLDEFEKANPRFFDLLLQVLGEGRLTDGAGNLADFRNSIIIMTSNLGVDSSSRGSVGFGTDHGASAVDSQANQNLANHFVREVQSFLRPEMFNRIDRIVPFGALDMTTLEQITHRELQIVRHRDGIHFRGVNLKVDDDVIDRLVEEGHDLRYGARPLKRAIEEHMLRPLAMQAIEYGASQSLTAQVSKPEKKNDVLSVRVKSQQNDHVVSEQGINAEIESQQLTDTVCEIRRLVMRLEQTSVTNEARNELFRYETAQEKRLLRYQEKIAEGQTQVPYPTAPREEVERLARLQPFLSDLDSIKKEATSLEDDVLLAIYQGHAFETELVADAVVQLQERWERVLLMAYALTYSEIAANKILMTVYFTPDSQQFASALIRAYSEVAEKRDLRVAYYSLRPPSKNEPNQLQPEEFWVPRRRGEDADKGITFSIARTVDLSKALGQVEKTGVFGIAMAVRGTLATPMLESEVGRHDLAGTSGVQRCLIDASAADIQEFSPNIEVQRKGFIGLADERRIWDERTRRVHNKRQRGEGETFARTRMAETLDSLIRDHLLTEARRLIE